MRTTEPDRQLATPLLESRDLPADDARFFVGNELQLSGWALGATGPAEVSAEIDGLPVPVLTGVESRDAVNARPEITQAERAGFEIRVDTSEWERGERQIRIVALDGAGGETSRNGTLDVLPHQIASYMLRTIAADAAAGRPVLRFDQPALDGSYEAGDRLAVQGFAYALSGIEAVLVSLDGRWRKTAEYGRRRADLINKVHPDAGNAGFELHVDISDVEDGKHWLTVVAVARDGQAVGREGPIRKRHRKRPQSRRLGPDGKPIAPERFLPEFHGHLFDAEYQARYRWAARHARDMEVLDAACGVGSGSAILAEASARRVVGLDRDAKAILNARQRAGDVAEFLLGDLRTLPFEESSFDLVTCFEAMDHIVELDGVLDELRRVLRQDGTLLISSLNPETFSPAGSHPHVHEYTPDELRAALSQRFANVRLHGQHAHLASVLADNEVFAAEGGHAPVPVEVYKLSAAPAELYTVAAASDAELPVLGDIVTLGGVFEVRQLFEYAWAWEDRAIAAEADAAASRTERNITELARKRVEESERARQRAQAQLKNLTNSKSWTLTAPLRQAAEVLRRRRLR